MKSEKEFETKTLIATWTLAQDPTKDAPVKLRWEDGTPAAASDFARIISRTQSDPDVDERTVEFSYRVA